jgi:mono/diheme cytochrome c family protein
MGTAKVALPVFFGLGSLVAASTTVQPPSSASAAATVSGTVESASPFTAAQVYIRNVDKRILYMVYTDAGQFRAVQMFPGNYEVSATTKGFESDVQKVVLKAGENPRLKLALQPARGAAAALEERSYDEIYPAGPGRDVAERTCIICHQENFLPSRPGSEAVWKARFDRMLGTFLPTRAAASYAEGLLSYRAQALRFSRQDRDDLLAYMLENFGPNRARCASSRKCRWMKRNWGRLAHDFAGVPMAPCSRFSISIGSGKTMVEFFSDAISVNVCR